MSGFEKEDLGNNQFIPTDAMSEVTNEYLKNGLDLIFTVRV
jgi:hypothetical protein